MARKRNYTPNEMRSRMMNSQDLMGKSASDNRSNQLNPNNSEYKGNKKCSK
ncbi:MAG: hypothetical protein P8Y97_10860 [Candidatus Lokiarchaeota archaeon]